MATGAIADCLAKISLMKINSPIRLSMKMVILSGICVLADKWEAMMPAAPPPMNTKNPYIALALPALSGKGSNGP